MKIQTTRYLDVSLREIENTMKRIFINHAKRPLIIKMVQDSYVKVVIAVVSQQCGIVFVNLNCPPLVPVTTAKRQGTK